MQVACEPSDLRTSPTISCSCPRLHLTSNELCSLCGTAQNPQQSMACRQEQLWPDDMPSVALAQSAESDTVDPPNETVAESAERKSSAPEESASRQAVLDIFGIFKGYVWDTSGYFFC